MVLRIIFDFPLRAARTCPPTTGSRCGLLCYARRAAAKGNVKNILFKDDRNHGQIEQKVRLINVDFVQIVHFWLALEMLVCYA